MQKNGKSKISKFVGWILLVCLLITGNSMQVGASDAMELNGVNAMRQKCASVFEVDLVYVDAQNEAHIIKTGNGFLTGNGEDVSYVITSRETVCAEEELREQIIEEYSLKPETEIQFIPRLVIKGDVVMDAEVIVSSEEMGFAVLKLQQSVHGREVLCFSNEPQDIQTMETIYSIGSNDIVAEGQIFKWLEEAGISLLWHNAILNGQGSGNPLLDERGNVIAINTQLLETGYMQAVDIEEVIAVLDVFGVPYSMAEMADTAPTLVHTETFIQPPETEDILQKDISNMESTTEQEDMKSFPIIFWTGISVVTLMLIGIILLIFRIIAGDKKKDKEPLEGKKKTTESLPSSISYQQKAVLSEETRMLGMNASMNQNPIDVEATTILNGRMGMEECKGFLIRQKNGECIYLSRSLFVIGSDGLRVDYCIKDNKSISRVHAQVRQLSGVYTLENLHATNGTYLNGVRLQDSEVKPLIPGDSIRLANEEFMFDI